MFNTMLWMVVVLSALGTAVRGEPPAPPPLSYSMDGETVIAVFAGLHTPATPSSSSRHVTRSTRERKGHTNSVTEGGGVAECGSVSWRDVQQAAAAEWALQAINNQTSPDHRIGLRILDTCSSPELAVQQLMTLLRETSKPEAAPLIGVVSVGGAIESGALLPLLAARSVPLLVTSAEAAYDLSPSPVLFASTPHLDIQMQSLVAAMGRLLPRAGGSRVGVVWSCWRAAESLKREAAKAGLVITLTTQVTHTDPNSLQGGQTVPLQQQILHFASDNKLQSGDVVILLLKVDEAHQLAQGHPVQRRPSSGGGPQPLKHLRLRWLLSSVEDDPLAHEIDILQLNEALPGVVVVGPHSPHLTMLQRRLADEVCSQHEDINNSGGKSSGGANSTGASKEGNGTKEAEVASILAPVLRQYCQKLKQEETTTAHPISINLLPEILLPRPALSASHPAPSTASSLMVDATHSASVLRAVSSLAAAFRILQLEHCSAMKGCTIKLGKDLPKRMVEGLQKLSYDAGEGADRLHYTADARLFTTFSIVTVVQGELMQVGLFREGAGVEWSEEPLPHMQQLLRDSTRPPFSLSKPLVAHKPVHLLPQPEKGAEWRATAWSVFVCVAAAVGLVCCCCIATYVSIRGCDGTLQGSQVPGLLVLAGTCGVLTGAVVMILPVQLTDAAALCCLQHLLPYTALALAYAALLTKALHARLQHALESRTQIPRAVLYLPMAALMALAVLLAALGDQTTMHLLLPNEIPAAPRAEAALAAYTAPALASSDVIALHSTEVVDDTRPLTFEIVQICKRLDQIPAIIGFSYLIVMLFVTLVILATSKSTKTKPDDFYECRRVIVVCGVSIPLVALWGAVTQYAPLHLQPPLTALSLLLVAYALIGLYLLPKLRHITSRNTKQFSHKPLSGAGTISTVYTSSTKLPATPIVSYTSRGDDGGCRFSDAIMCNDLIEKYKLRDGSSCSSDRAQTVASGVLVSPYKIPRPETIFPTLQPSQHQCGCEGQWEATAMRERETKGRRP